MSIQPDTLTYSTESKGWPSFYDYLPEYMVGMNQYFYTFHEGNLYRHNVNESRNNYYGQANESSITGVLNLKPAVIKLFKTMYYESDAAWSCTSLFTDLSAGSMISTFFEQKEGEWFTFIRENAGTINLKARSVIGIEPCTNLTGPVAGVYTIRFGNIDTDPATSTAYQNIPPSSEISIGDIAYGSIGGVETELGPITNITSTNINIQSTGGTTLYTMPVYGIEVDTSATGAVPSLGQFIYVVKDAVAESHGARGYFMQYTLTNSSIDAVELFQVGSNAMKSFP